MWMNRGILRDEAGEGGEGGGGAGPSADTLLGEGADGAGNNGGSEGGGQEGGQPTPNSDAGTANPWYSGLYNEKGEFSENWTERLPEHLKEHKDFLGRYKTIDVAMSSLVEKQKALSSKGLARPEEGAPQAIVDEFNAKLHQLNGAPGNSGDYDFSPPDDLPEHLRWGDDESTRIQEVLHKHHASPQLAGEIRDVYTKIIAEQEDGAIAQFNKNEDAAVKALGDDLGKVSSDMQATMKILGFEADDMKVMLNSAVQAGLGEKFMRNMASLKGLIDSDKFVNLSGANEGGVMGGQGQNYEELAAKELDSMYAAEKAGDHAAVARHRQQEDQYRKLAAQQKGGK